jgi:5-methylcytosine-specific restriction endonuclease McrA
MSRAAWSDEATRGARGAGQPPWAHLRVPVALRDWDWNNNARRRRRLVAAVLAAKGRTCRLCGQPGATTADHTTPWSHGGLNVIANLEPAHLDCNRKRNDMPLGEWFVRYPLTRRTSAAPSRHW